MPGAAASASTELTGKRRAESWLDRALHLSLRLPYDAFMAGRCGRCDRDLNAGGLCGPCTSSVQEAKGPFPLQGEPGNSGGGVIAFVIIAFLFLCIVAACNEG